MKAEHGPLIKWKRRNPMPFPLFHHKALRCPTDTSPAHPLEGIKEIIRQRLEESGQIPV